MMIDINKVPRGNKTLVSEDAIFLKERLQQLGLIESLTNALESAKSKISELEDTVNEINNTAEITAVEVKSNDLASLEHELDARGTLLATLQIETRRLSENLGRIEAENQSLTIANNMLQVRSMQLTEKFDNVSEKLQKVESSVEERDKHVEILQRQLRLSEQNTQHLNLVVEKQQHR